VYRWDAKTALVQTVDFFTPIVDDPYIFGQIAAANALSDIYAMGATPLTALAIAAFPAAAGEAGIIGAVFRGGFDKLREAGVALLGGHTVQDREIKFGYAVTGIVDPGGVLSNAGARPGDVLLLTKPIGTGVIATAIKHGRAPQAAIDAAVRTMVALNREAADALRALPRDAVHACTDVTGFGLIGHAREMADGSHVTLCLEAAAVPVLDGALDLARANRSGGLGTNEAYFRTRMTAAPTVDRDRLTLLFDPQTSGGLLVAVDPRCEADLVGRWRVAGTTGVRVGTVVEPLAAAIQVE
jgi:selenide, water dikinase